MADETAVLAEKLELGPVHVVGASMGGMIAQLFAARHPELTSSLVSIMSNTGSRVSGQPALSIYRHFLTTPPNDREAFIDRTVNLFRIIGSSELGFDEEQMRDVITRSYDRDHDPRGTGRQLGAIAKSGNRTEGPAQDHGADPGRPRDGRQAGSSLRRQGDRKGDQGRRADDGQGHGPRPAAPRLGANHRRNLPHGRSRRRGPKRSRGLGDLRRDAHRPARDGRPAGRRPRARRRAEPPSRRHLRRPAARARTR